MARFIEIPGSGKLRVPAAHPKKRAEPERSTGINPLAFQTWVDYFKYGGLSYGLTGSDQTMGDGFTGRVHGALKSCSVVYACEAVRVSIFSEANFMWRQRRNGRPGNLFSTPELERLREPWPGGTTGDLLGQMLLHADFAGNAFARRRANGIGLLRPDWVTILYGSQRDRDELGGGAWDPDAELLGYLYHPGGRQTGSDPIPYTPDEIAHFMPMPDPEHPQRGMSWLTPVVAEILGDKAASAHKLKFFEHGATPNLAVKLDMADPEKFQAWAEIFEEKYEGVNNAYKTMIMGAGADYTVVGADFKQIDFKVTQGAGETRIAAAAGVPPVIVGLSEGLQGSSLNAGNYGMARRRLGDVTMRPLWRNISGSLARITDVPLASELWYDETDIAFLREDQADAAEITTKHASAIRGLTDGGYDPASVVDAVVSGDLMRLVHTGLLSVQMQPPGSGESDDDDDGDRVARGHIGMRMAEGWTIVPGTEMYDLEILQRTRGAVAFPGDGNDA